MTNYELGICRNLKHHPKSVSEIPDQLLVLIQSSINSGAVPTYAASHACKGKDNSEPKLFMHFQEGCLVSLGSAV